MILILFSFQYFLGSELNNWYFQNYSGQIAFEKTDSAKKSYPKTSSLSLNIIILSIIHSANNGRMQ